MLFADKKGAIRGTEQRKCFSIVDAVVAGEGEGPLLPSPIQCGMVIGGVDPLRVDNIAAFVMGFDPNKIPMLGNSDGSEKLRFSNFDPQKDIINIISNIDSSGDWYKGLFKFKPPQGWIKHIEL